MPGMGPQSNPGPNTPGRILQSSGREANSRAARPASRREPAAASRVPRRMRRGGAERCARHEHATAIATVMASLFILSLVAPEAQQAWAQRLQPGQAQALRSLWQAWGRPPALRSWANARACPQAQGVGCSQGGSILAVNASGLGLAGPLPPALTRLTALANLSLSQNRLHGRIPPQLSALQSLRTLDAFNNSLSGVIPLELSRLTALQVLELGYNLLEGGLEALAGCQALQDIRIRVNHLQGTIPEDWSRLTALSHLALSYNQLSGSVPAFLGDLKDLDILVLGYNALSSTIPASLGQLSLLSALHLGSNALTSSVPESFSNLTSLEILVLFHNRLEGSLSFLGSLQSLSIIALQDNLFSGTVPATLAGLPGLNMLGLGINLLTGPIPPELGSLLSLQYLALQYNRLSGEVPSSLGRLTSLTELRLSYNKLSGSIPESLGDLTALGRLELARNQLVGVIPASLSQLTTLVVLSLGGNRLLGPFPASLCHLTWLMQLGVDENLLSGSIPTTISSLVYLTYLNLAGNRLSEGLEALSNLAQMVDLRMSSNNFSGPFPVGFSRLGQLTLLQAAGNQITGPLKPVLALPGLQELELSNNPLAGEQLAGATGLKALTQLGLTGCGLTGGIPSHISSLAGLQSLFLGQNNLSGPIPETLSALWSLQHLELGGNRLQGSLPSGLVKLSNLTALLLSDNSLNGSVLAGIGALTKLQSLQLGHNRLSGELPPQLARLALLEEFNVSSNALSGALPEVFSKWALLQKLGLGGNRGLQGDVGELFQQLQSLTALEHLDLALPGLHGAMAPVGPSLALMTALTSLSLAGANVTGSVPDVFRSVPSLRQISLEGSGMSGDLPSSLGLLSLLSSLRLPGTLPCPPSACSVPVVDISGPFCTRCAAFCSTCPRAAFNSTHVAALLRFQRVSGIPGVWGPGSLSGVKFENGRATSITISDLSYVQMAAVNVRALLPLAASLTRLELSRCNAAGQIPDELGLLTSLQELVLGKNQLSGPIPSSLGSLLHLTWLDLSGQALDSWMVKNFKHAGMRGGLSRASVLSALTALQRLSLAKAQLAEPFPDGLSRLRSLRLLDLSSNSLSGSLPEGLTELTHLSFLNLRSNQLSGAMPQGLAYLPLQVFHQDSLDCPLNRTCMPERANRTSPFCTEYCASFCKPCLSPEPPPPRPEPTPSPVLPPPPKPTPAPPSEGFPAGAITAIAIGAAVVLLAAVVTVVCILRSWAEARDDVQKRGIRRFSPKELQKATEGFSQILGGGAAGQVFKGVLESGEVIAVKRGTPNAANVDDVGFRNEIKLLSWVHHKHLVALLGYCLDPSKRLLLVYECVEQGSLDSLLKKEPQSLTWERRLRIAFGAALGLDYLHSQITPPIVHCDVKSANILITRDFEAKVGDFGISQEGLKGLSRKVKGTRGYLDPEYMASGEPTLKSDVYSFGVVLLELASDWKPVDRYQHILQRVLTTANSDSGLDGVLAPSLRPFLVVHGSPCSSNRDSRSALEAGSLPARLSSEHSAGEAAGEDVDSLGSRKGQLTPSNFRRFVSLACRCCASESEKRPTMYQVSNELEDIQEGVGGAEAASEIPIVPHLTATSTKGPLSVTELLDIGITGTEIIVSVGDDMV